MLLFLLLSLEIKMLEAKGDGKTGETATSQSTGLDMDLEGSVSYLEGSTFLWLHQVTEDRKCGPCTLKRSFLPTV